MVEPYYDDGQIVIYRGDCRELLPLVAPPAPNVLVLTDPPYGIAERTNRAEVGRGKQAGRRTGSTLSKSGAKAVANNFPPIHGDDEPFDPSHLLAYKRLVMFGANHFSDKLPPSSSWVVWDKIDGLPPSEKRAVGINDNGDGEMAWSNLGGPVRILRHRWMGMLRSGCEMGQRTLHPTQKPVALMQQIIGWRSGPDDLIVDPYMGSGSALVAAQALNRRAVGIEMSEAYCDIARARLQQVVMDFGGTA